MKLGQLSKQLAIILGTKSYQLARQAGQKIRYTIKQDNLYYNNIAKGIQETKTEEEEHDDLPLPDPETITQVVALNEKLAEELRQQVTGGGIDCQAIEVNSLPIEYKPYYSYKFPMSPKITRVVLETALTIGSSSVAGFFLELLVVYREKRITHR